MKKGFTLAEILITVAVIGVVAALTIPAVAKKVQDNQLKTAFKKTYSNLTNAYAKTIADLGYTPECYYTTPYASGQQKFAECDFFWNEFIKNLKLIKTCNGNALQDGCVPKYTSYPTSVGCTVVNEENFNNNSIAMVLADGTILVKVYGLVYLDINGKKAPNKGGYDFFNLGFFIPENKTQPTLTVPDDTHGSCLPIETGGKTSYKMLKYSFQ